MSCFQFVVVYSLRATVITRLAQVQDGFWQYGALIDTPIRRNVGTVFFHQQYTLCMILRAEHSSLSRRTCRIFGKYGLPSRS